MIANLMGTRNPHINFNIMFYPQYQDDEGKVVCHPGSVFEGIVQVKVTEPMPIHHIKLVFKASERVNYDAMGWEKSKDEDDKLFAVRTVLWGLPSGADIPVEHWPIIPIGEHNLPFVCQMPMVNFPPTFHHHLIATAFNMTVSAKKAGDSQPIISKPVPICFRPIIETTLTKNLVAFTEETKLTNHIVAHVSVPRLAYSIFDKNQSIPVTVQFTSDSKHNEEHVALSKLCVYIKRYYGINYKTFSRNETTVIAQYDHPKIPSTCPSTMTMELNLPKSQNELPATLTYSPHLNIGYRLIVSVKVRHGPIHVKKKLFDMPVIFGTLPPGAHGPRRLEAYSEIIGDRLSLHSKPNFLRPEPKNTEEFLPAYDGDIIPPAYCSTIAESSRALEITM